MTLTTRDIIGLNSAANVAQHSFIRFRMGAWSSTGHWAVNSTKTHPRMVQLGYPGHCNRHAELALVIGAGRFNLVDSTVYVARLLRDGSWALAKPCAFCMYALAEANVARVMWTVAPGEGDCITL